MVVNKGVRRIELDDSPLSCSIGVSVRKRAISCRCPTLKCTRTGREGEACSAGNRSMSSRRPRSSHPTRPTHPTYTLAATFGLQHPPTLPSAQTETIEKENYISIHGIHNNEQLHKGIVSKIRNYIFTNILTRI